MTCTFDTFWMDLHWWQYLQQTVRALQKTFILPFTVLLHSNKNVVAPLTGLHSLCILYSIQSLDPTAGQQAQELKVYLSWWKVWAYTDSSLLYDSGKALWNTRSYFFISIGKITGPRKMNPLIVTNYICSFVGFGWHISLFLFKIILIQKYLYKQKIYLLKAESLSERSLSVTGIPVLLCTHFGNIKGDLQYRKIKAFIYRNIQILTQWVMLSDTDASTNNTARTTVLDVSAFNSCSKLGMTEMKLFWVCHKSSSVEGKQ